jgi:hypothetical protein
LESNETGIFKLVDFLNKNIKVITVPRTTIFIHSIPLKGGSECGIIIDRLVGHRQREHGRHTTTTVGH